MARLPGLFVYSVHLLTAPRARKFVREDRFPHVLPTQIPIVLRAVVNILRDLVSTNHTSVSHQRTSQTLSPQLITLYSVERAPYEFAQSSCVYATPWDVLMGLITVENEWCNATT